MKSKMNAPATESKEWPEVMLERVPQAYIRTYEKEHLDGRSLWDIAHRCRMVTRLRSMTILRRLWIALAAFLCGSFLAPHLSSVELISICVFTVGMFLVTVGVHVVGMIILNGISGKQVKTIEELTAEFYRFQELVGTLDPVHGGDVHDKASLMPDRVSQSLVRLSVNLLKAERDLDTLCTGSDVQRCSIISCVEDIQLAKKRLEEMWDAADKLKIFSGDKKKHFFDLAKAELSRKQVALK